MKSLGWVVVALLLAFSTQPAPAIAAPSSETPRLHREYGQDAVKIPSAVARVLLTFHGRRGDKVLLNTYPSSCPEDSLRGPSGQVVAPWYDHLWSLPATGRYTFDHRRCSTQSGYLQLVKVRLRPLPVNGDAVTLRSSKNWAYVDMATVVVPRRGRVQVRPPTTETPPSDWDTVYVKGAPSLQLGGWHQDRTMGLFYLEAGAPVANELAELTLPDPKLVPQAGERVILRPVERRVRVRATKTLLVPGTLDGGAIRVVAKRRFQEVGVRFESAGDQWVRATVTGRLTSRSLRSPALVGPGDRTLVGSTNATSGGNFVAPDLWYLPEAGSYRFMVRTDPRHDSGRIALSSVRELGVEMPADGQALAFTAQEPGEWVLATGELADVSYRFSAESTEATGWHAYANSLPFLPCRSSFCDGGTSAFAEPQAPSWFFPLHAAGRWVFLVAFEPGQVGTVSLRLTTPPPT